MTGANSYVVDTLLAHGQEGLSVLEKVVRHSPSRTARWRRWRLSTRTAPRATHDRQRQPATTNRRKMV
jgi:hypothetical protein